MVRRFENPVIAPIGGGIVAVNIAGGPEGERGECGGGTAQQAIVVTIQQPTNASFTVVEHDFDPVIYLRSECDDPQSMGQCNDSNGQASRIPENGGTICNRAPIFSSSMRSSDWELETEQPL